MDNDIAMLMIPKNSLMESEVCAGPIKVMKDFAVEGSASSSNGKLDYKKLAVE